MYEFEGEYESGIGELLQNLEIESAPKHFTWSNEGHNVESDEEICNDARESVVVEHPIKIISPDEAILDLQLSYENSVPERIRKNRRNEYIDQLKSKRQTRLSKSDKRKHQSGDLMVDRLNLDNFGLLKKAFAEGIFMDSDRAVIGALSKAELRRQIEKVCHTTFQDDEWDMIFIKMDVNGHGYVFYDEFTNYLLLEFRIKENLEEDISLWTLGEPLQYVPTFLRSHHRHGVADITFSPLVMRTKDIGKVKKSSFANGKYLTVSESGTINTWSLNMELENTQECPSPVLHLAKTCVIKVAALADINLLVISSTERDLRFYDTTGRHYQLKTRIYKLPYPATALCYHFYEDVNEDSLLIFGDSEGSVSIMKFTSKQGGPLKKFVRSTKFDYQCISYDSLLKGAFTDRNLTMTHFKNLHPGSWVMKIQYSKTIWQGKEVIISCANVLQYSMVVIDVTEMKILKKFKITRGVNTYCLVEEFEQIITGGFDTIIRIWHIKGTKKNIASMSGHYAPIDALYEQHNGALLFSISRDKVIKVWDTREMVCIQTCCNKLQELGEATMVCFYNPHYRKCILAGNNIAYFKLGSEDNTFFSDGYTHFGGVTKALYNSLFKILVTVGMDSNIMTWDIWTGKLVFVIRKAHTKHVFAENKAMGISAAIFSPSLVYLLTGALDGSIKMWNFTIGTCLRTMYIETDCVVTGLVWVPGRILACGWNKHISEWEDLIEQGDCKEWGKVHTKDILMLTQCGTKAIVTASYNGELVFYNLQNGHYYNRFFVGKPNLLITMGFASAFQQGTKEKVEAFVAKSDDSLSFYTFSSSSSSSEEGSGKVPQRKHPDGLKTTGSLTTGSGFAKKPHQKTKKQTIVKEPEPSCDCDPVCECEAPEFQGFSGPDRMEIHCLLFLDSRPDHPFVGTLFVALQTGSVQLWSHHPKGGFLDAFYAVHVIGDYVTTMTTDVSNEFLFTGTRFGYVKIWHISNYGILPEMVVHRSMPRLRLQFPFLWDDIILGRAKRAARGQMEPFLCSSCRNHLDRIMHIELLEKQKIYVTCGLDRTARLWTYSGLYIGLLGGTNCWAPFKESDVVTVKPGKIPADLSRILSSTSLKVLTERCFVKTIKKLQEIETEKNTISKPAMEYRHTEFSEIFRGVCNFPEDDEKYQTIEPSRISTTEIIQKNMKSMVRVLNMLKTVGQYDISPPKYDRLARNIKQLLEDQDRKGFRGRPTPLGQPTRTRMKDRWAERMPSHQRFWRTSSQQIGGSGTAESIVTHKSDASQRTTSRSSSHTKQGLSTDAMDLELLLRTYEESAKGWYKQ